MNNKTFCSFPFNKIFLGPDAGIKTCCSSRGDIGNLNETPIHAILQGDIIKDIRRSIIAGEWHPQCSQCQELETKGGMSERLHTLYQLDEFKDATEETFKLQQIDLRWSNICNLACNYCYEYFSSQWASIKGIKVNDLNAHNQDLLLGFIEQHTSTIEAVNLLGGEPLLQKQNKRLLDIVEDKNTYILTNMSLPLESNAIAQQLIARKNVKWGVSFEAVGNKFEYIRHNASWDVLVKNLKYLRSTNPLQINTHPLYCNYSAFNLMEYYDFLYNEVDIDNIYWCIIDNIKELSPFYLPNNMKNEAVKEIDRVCEKYEGTKFEESLKSLRSIRVQMLGMHEPIDGDFIRWTQHIENTLPKKYKANILWPYIYEQLSLKNIL